MRSRPHHLESRQRDQANGDEEVLQLMHHGSGVQTPAAGYISGGSGRLDRLVEVESGPGRAAGHRWNKGLGVEPAALNRCDLLGRRMSGFGQAVLVEDFEPVRCEHLRGDSAYALSRRAAHLGGQLQRRKTLPGSRLSVHTSGTIPGSRRLRSLQPVLSGRLAGVPGGAAFLGRQFGDGGLFLLGGRRCQPEVALQAISIRRQTVGCGRLSPGGRTACRGLVSAYGAGSDPANGGARPAQAATAAVAGGARDRGAVSFGGAVCFPKPGAGTRDG